MDRDIEPSPEALEFAEELAKANKRIIRKIINRAKKLQKDPKLKEEMEREIEQEFKKP